MLQGKMFVELSVVNWLNKFVIKKILRYAQDDSGKAVPHPICHFEPKAKNLLCKGFNAVEMGDFLLGTKKAPSGRELSTLCRLRENAYINLKHPAFSHRHGKP